MFNWLHHLFNPHCSHCLEIERERHICLSCETLRTQLAETNYEKKQLLNKLLNNSTNPVNNIIPEENESPVQIPPRHLPWPVLRHRLEEQDRLKALELEKEKQIRADLDKRNAELEKEVLGAENHA